MKIPPKRIIVIAVVICGLIFIFSSFKRASAPPLVAQPGDLSEAPIRVYGTVEPAGRSVFVSPPVTKSVTEIYVREGDAVEVGQRLCDLESSVEQKQVELAKTKMALAQKSLILTKDEMQRSKELYKTRVDSEYRYTQAKIKYELDLKRIKVAGSELDVAKAQLEQTILRSPIQGIVYKLDLRLGETLASGDNDRIVLGKPERWVRLSVESFWREKIAVGSKGTVFDSETGEQIGTGTIVQKMPYVGRRDFRTEDLQERFDTKFQEFILALDPQKKDIPIGLSVVAQFN